MIAFRALLAVTTLASLPWLALAGGAPGAIETLRLSLGALEGPGWRAEGVSVALRPSAGNAGALAVEAERLVLPEPVGRLSDVRLDCPRVTVEPAAVTCEDGRLRLDHPWLDAPGMAVSLRYQRPGGALSLSAAEVAAADGQWQLEGRWKAGSGRVQFEGEASVAGLWRPVAAAWAGGGDAQVSQGRARVQGSVAVARGALETATVDARVRDLGFSARQGWMAGQALDGRFELSLALRPDAWRFEAQASIAKGEAAAGAFFLAAPSSRPLTVTLEGRWQAPQGRWAVERLRYGHPGVGTVTGQARLRRAEQGLEVERLELAAEDLAVAGLYETYMRPALYGTTLSDLELEGTADVRLDYRAGAPVSVRVASEGIDAVDRGGRFGVEALAGVVDWGSVGDEPVFSRLGWERAHVFGWMIGPAQARLASQGNGMRLAEPVSVPVMGGTLQIETLSAQRPGTEQFSWRFDGVLTPIDMTRVTEALGWPPMSGELSGVIPEVAYRDQTLSIGGTLLVRLFDGQVLVRGLELVRPFDVAPRLAADVEVKHLNLDKLTRHFAFGSIQGGISGYVRGLRMEDWRPVGFDAWFATPPDDPLPHRISQKAVDNLSRLGGGVGGVVSRGFLRFFEQFRYARLGIGCRLEAGTCHMKGLDSQDETYTLVRGGGLPRINVVGYNRRVDWDVLVKRLQNVTQTPTVQ